MISGVQGTKMLPFFLKEREREGENQSWSGGKIGKEKKGGHERVLN